MKANKVVLIAAGSVLTAGLLFSFTKGDEKEKMKRYTVIHQKDGVQKTFDTLIPMSSMYTVENFLKDRGIEATEVKKINLTKGHPRMHALEEEIEWQQEGSEDGEMKRVEIRVEEENGERKITKIVDGKEVPMTEEELEKMNQQRHHRMKMHHGMDHHMEWNTDEGEELEIKVTIDENGQKKVTKLVDGKEVPLTDEEKAKIEQMKKGHPHMMFRGEGAPDMVFEIEDGSGENVQIKVEVTEDGKVIKKKIVNGEEVDFTPAELEKMKAHHRKHMVFVEHDVEEGSEGEDKDVKLKVHIDENGEMQVDKWVNGEKVEVSEEEMEKIRSHKPHEGGEHVMIHRIEREHGDHDKDRKVHEKRHEMHLMRMHGDKDFTVVLIEENIPFNQAKTKSSSLEKGQNVEGAIQVYPNPSSGVVNIAFDQKEKLKTTVQVMDVAGKVVFKENLGKFEGSYKKELNLKEFGAGTYVVEINQGDQRTTKKVIVQ